MADRFGSHRYVLSRVVVVFLVAALASGCSASSPAPLSKNAKAVVQHAPTRPTRPAPVIPPADRAPIGQTPTETYGNLEVQPLPADFNSVCEGQFQAGQVVQLHGSGYRPGANVVVDLSSPGEGSNFKHQVASLVANATGDINANVRIPLGTSGFTVPGQSESMAFLEATGTSSTSMQTRQIDNAMVGIAKPGSHCATVGGSG
ncbi:MAG: hypothetical protein ACYDEP_01115 [Acidimicrobiales bacterium]